MTVTQANFNRVPFLFLKQVLSLTKLVNANAPLRSEK